MYDADEVTLSTLTAGQEYYICVDSFNENEIIFLTSAGMMTITGEDLHITKLNLDEGMLIIDGTVDSIDYSDHEEERMNSKKLFKVFR